MSKIRILAVDDNAVNLATLEQELEDEYEVIAVNSGMRAIKVVCREPVDLILLDVMMPIMDGIETLREIRSLARGADVPVILLTASNERDTVMAGVKLNILGYIVKPFESEDLHRRIRQVLKSRGLLPLEGAELYQSVRELALQLQENNTDQALSTVKEILEYKLDEEIAGRMNVVRTSLELGEPELAKPMATRTMQFLAEKGLSAPQGKGRTYNKMELTVRLRYILNALDKLQPKEAIEKINALLQYNMPAGCQSNCQRALKALQQRNTAEAKKLLRSTLTQISAQD